MPAYEVLTTLSAIDVSALLRELFLRPSLPFVCAPPQAALALIQAGLARLEQEQLVAVDQEDRAQIIRSAVDDWLPGVLDENAVAEPVDLLLN